MRKYKILAKKKSDKKEPNCNYRIENHNNKKKFSGGAQHLIQSVDLRMDMRREKKQTELKINRVSEIQETITKDH